MSLGDLARASGLSKTILARIERGDGQPVGRDAVADLAGARRPARRAARPRTSAPRVRRDPRRGRASRCARDSGMARVAAARRRAASTAPSSSSSSCPRGADQRGRAAPARAPRSSSSASSGRLRVGPVGEEVELGAGRRGLVRRRRRRTATRPLRGRARARAGCSTRRRRRGVSRAPPSRSLAGRRRRARRLREHVRGRARRAARGRRRRRAGGVGAAGPVRRDGRRRRSALRLRYRHADQHRLVDARAPRCWSPPGAVDGGYRRGARRVRRRRRADRRSPGCGGRSARWIAAIPGAARQRDARRRAAAGLPRAGRARWSSCRWLAAPGRRRLGAADALRAAAGRCPGALAVAAVAIAIDRPSPAPARAACARARRSTAPAFDARRAGRPRRCRCSSSRWPRRTSPGMSVLRQLRLPRRRCGRRCSRTGAATVVGAPFGAHAINLAAITAALGGRARRRTPTRSGAGSRRSARARSTSCSALGAGLATALVAAVAAAADRGGRRPGAARRARRRRCRAPTADAGEREAAIVTLRGQRLGRSPRSGISAPFWGLVAGLGVPRRCSGRGPRAPRPTARVG